MSDREHADRDIEPGDFLVEDGLVPGRLAPPAILDRPGNRPPATLEKGVLPGAAPGHVVRVLVVVGPVAQAAPPLGVVLEPFPDLGSELGIVGAVVEVHDRTILIGSTRGEVGSDPPSPPIELQSESAPGTSWRPRRLWLSRRSVPSAEDTVQGELHRSVLTRPGDRKA